ncbi:MAG: hypothetical protein V9G29_06745 [Burkholderiaceae bacterium]
MSGEAVFENTKYWTSKGNINTLFINEAKDELLLTGNIPQNIESVSINGYKLQEFIPGGNSFTYKVSKSSGTLLE